MMPEVSLVGVLIVTAVAFVVPLTLGLAPAPLGALTLLRGGKRPSAE
jgi:hypothetical protein